MVCSSKEVAQLRGFLGAQGLLVVPGIRPAGSPADDQSRTATPATALADGASLLVVGRPITQSPNPAAATEAIFAEMSLAH
jgi:orotidine-5'-phosphate decarboxylase